MRHTGEKVEKIIVGVLQLGSGVSAALMIAGLGLFLAHSGTGPNLPGPGFMGFRQSLTGVLSLQPMALMTLGIMVLLLTPFLRVVGAFLSFSLVEKDFKYALISFGVLLILTASFFVPGFK